MLGLMGWLHKHSTVGDFDNIFDICFGGARFDRQAASASRLNPRRNFNRNSVGVVIFVVVNGNGCNRVPDIFVGVLPIEGCDYRLDHSVVCFNFDTI
jgi:hypothetical protein